MAELAADEDEAVFAFALNRGEEGLDHRGLIDPPLGRRGRVPREAVLPDRAGADAAFHDDAVRAEVIEGGEHFCWPRTFGPERGDRRGAARGQFSHGLIKQAAKGDYRIQSLYGGIEVAVAPTEADRQAAEAVMAMLPFKAPPLYARIDMVRLDSGELAVIEAELIEPYLYPLQCAEFGVRMAEGMLGLV